MDKWFKKKYSVKVDNRMKYFGETDTTKKTIKINKRKAKKSGQKGELLDSIRHEVLHAKHPRKSEKRIQKMTERSTKRMSKRSKQKTYNLLNAARRNR